MQSMVQPWPTSARGKSNPQTGSGAYRDNVPAIEEKRKALAANKTYPRERKIQALRAARSNMQRCVRRWANEYWFDLCTCIQTGVKKDIIKAIYMYVRWNQAGTWSFSEQNSGPDLTTIRAPLVIGPNYNSDPICYRVRIKEIGSELIFGSDEKLLQAG